jgi:hypothetical protein
MIECLSAIDEKTITERINTLIANYIKEKELYSNNQIEFYLNLLSISDFPKPTNTGNEILDNENYKQAVENWGISNPEKFKMLKSSIIKLY